MIVTINIIITIIIIMISSSSSSSSTITITTTTIKDFLQAVDLEYLTANLRAKILDFRGFD